MLKGLLSSMLALAVTGAVSAGDVPSIYSPRALRIDGRLNDAIYRQAPVIKNFTRADGKTVERPTECQIVFTPTSVVFAFTAYIPKDKLKLPVNPTRRDKSTTSCDAVEIMCDPSGKVDTYKHFILNASGGILDRLCEQGGYVGDTKWDVDWQYKYQILADRWTCEIAIPYRSLGITSENRDWKLNLARESFGAVTAPWELSSICQGKFNVSGDFVTLKVPPQVKLKDYMIFANNPVTVNKVQDGKSNVTISSVLENLQDAPVSINCECIVAVPGSIDLRDSAEAKLGAKGKQEIKFKRIVLAKPGVYDASINFRNAATNRLLHKVAFKLDARYTPIKIDLIDPHYRNAIFATQKLDKVRFTVKSDLAGKSGKMVIGIKTLDGKVVTQKDVSAAKEVNFEYPVDKLPDGKMNIFVAYNGETVTHPLRKLPRKAGEVWRGKDGNWFRDGKKLFINSSWSHAEGFFPENNIVFTGAPPEDKNLLFANSQLMLGRPAKMLADMREGKLTPQVFDFYRRKVEMLMDHPQIFAHFLCDEPDIYGFTQQSFAELAKFIVDVDPYHPIFNSTGSSGLIDFADSSELNGFHPYPRPSRTQPMANFDKIVYYMDRGNEHFAKTNRKVSITFLHQGFDYSDSGLSNSHVPSFEEFRNQNLLSFVLGGIGIMQYNRGVVNAPELYIGLAELTKELHIVGNEAIIQETAADKCTDVTKNLRTLAKYNPETKQYWVLVFNASFDTAEYQFKFKPFAGKKLQVLSEKRNIQVGADGKISEKFTPYQARVYTTDLRDFKLKSVAEINAAIEGVYAKLAAENAGNLAYQRLDGLSVKVTASSNKFNIVRAENSLWRVADGITDGKVPCNSPGGFGTVHWCDKTPRVFPDWIDLEFVRKPQTVGRVEVYPVGNSLKDYHIQLLVNGKYVTVGSVKNASGRLQTVTFKPQQCDAVRLVATAGNEAYTRIYEIKVFAK